MRTLLSSGTLLQNLITTYTCLFCIFLRSWHPICLWLHVWTAGEVYRISIRQMSSVHIFSLICLPCGTKWALGHGSKFFQRSIVIDSDSNTKDITAGVSRKLMVPSSLAHCNRDISQIYLHECKPLSTIRNAGGIKWRIAWRHVNVSNLFKLGADLNAIISFKTWVFGLNRGLDYAN